MSEPIPAPFTVEWHLAEAEHGLEVLRGLPVNAAERELWRTVANLTAAVRLLTTQQTPTTTEGDPS